MRSVESSGRTVDEAVQEALNKLGAQIEDVTVEVLEEGSKGLLGIFGSRQARVRVSLMEVPAIVVDEQPGDEALASAVEAELSALAEQEAPEEDGKVDRERAIEIACAFVHGVAERLGLKVGIETSEGDEGIVHVNMTGENVGLIIGHHGQTLDAVQYLANVVANQKSTERVRLVLDAEGYRVRREATLTNLAQRMAAKAVAQRRRAVLEPMSALERRVIHLALQESDEVTTYSEGEEPYRRVVIAPK